MHTLCASHLKFTLTSTLHQACPAAHLVPLPADAAGIDPLLARKRHAELAAHLLGRAHAQLVERVLKHVLAPHRDAQAAVRALLHGANLGPAATSASDARFRVQ